MVKYKLIAGCFILALIVSLLMVIEGVPTICEPGKSCDIVKTSPYATTFGIFNAYYGVAIFLFMNALLFTHIIRPTKEKKRLIIISGVIGSIIALRFIYLQAFVLKAYCTYCIVVDVSVITTLILLFALKDHD